jgi:restriction system protein
MPSGESLDLAVLEAIEACGGAATNREISEYVASNLALSAEQISAPHGEFGEGGRTELEYRLAWARTRLRGKGKIFNESKGTWANAPLSERGR